MDRRRAKSQRLSRRHPLFVNVSRNAAATILAGSVLAVTLVSRVAQTPIGYGPTFLLLCAFAAWFVGNRFAVILGIFITAIQIVSGQMIDLRTANITEIVDLSFQLGSSLTVILMLGVARVALEIEWRTARIDPLTGAINRNAFFEAMEEEAKKASMAVLIFADLDGLKKLNDTWGHEQGDEALKNFSKSVRAAIRKDDLFARIGGDEFVVFLNVRDLPAAYAVADRLDQVINHARSGSEVALTCSLGVLILPRGSTSIDAELREADSLMYRAKHHRSGSAVALSAVNYPVQHAPFAKSGRFPPLGTPSIRSIERPLGSPRAEGVAVST